MQFRIKEARKAANLTQRELAEMLGIKVSTLSGYEVGTHDPKSNTLADIARICSTTVDYLLGLSNNEIQPADIGELSDEEERFIKGVAELTPSNRRILLGILSVLLQEQGQGPGSPG